jgi:hypothetical protein
LQICRFFICRKMLQFTSKQQESNVTRNKKELILSPPQKKNYICMPIFNTGRTEADRGGFCWTSRGCTKQPDRMVKLHWHHGHSQTVTSYPWRKSGLSTFHLLYLQ